jgi:hypothetical protein
MLAQGDMPLPQALQLCTRIWRHIGGKCSKARHQLLLVPLLLGHLQFPSLPLRTITHRHCLPRAVDDLSPRSRSVPLNRCSTSRSNPPSLIPSLYELHHHHHHHPAPIFLPYLPPNPVLSSCSSSYRPIHKQSALQVAHTRAQHAAGD